MTLLQHASEHRHGRAELDVAAVFAKIHAHLRGREASGLPSGRASDDLRGPDRRQAHPALSVNEPFASFYHYYYTTATTTTTTASTTTTAP